MSKSRDNRRRRQKAAKKMQAWRRGRFDMKAANALFKRVYGPLIEQWWLPLIKPQRALLQAMRFGPESLPAVFERVSTKPWRTDGTDVTLPEPACNAL